MKSSAAPAATSAWVSTAVTPSMAAFLEANAPWSQLVAHGNVELRPVMPGDSFEPWPGLTVRLVGVPHRDEFTDTVGVSVADSLFYLPDIDGWDEWPEAATELERHAISLLDATFHDPSELPERNVAEIKHPLVTDTIARFGHLTRHRRIVLTHLNHSNPVGRPDSPERWAAQEAGFEIAEDMAAYPIG